MIDVHDIQNYYLSFFGGIYFPTAETVEEIEKEVEEDLKDVEY